MLEAIQGSIDKWESIVAGDTEDNGSSDCPLCKLYLEDDCLGCPIRKKTGSKLCRGTPYTDFLYYDTGDYELKEMRQKYAERMLDFLKELKDDYERTNRETIEIRSE